jgi:hypothetical protein
LRDFRPFGDFSSPNPAMTILPHCCGKVFRPGWRWLAMALLVVGFSGCAGWGVHDDGFAENDLSQTARKARPQQKKDLDYWSYSEKGRQIERDLPPM